MREILEKRTKDEELHNYSFDAEIFRRTFNGYVRKFNTISAVVVILICAPFVAYAIAMRFYNILEVNKSG